MRVTATVLREEQDVEVTIGVDEIAAALAEASFDAEEGEPPAVCRLLNSVAQVLKAITSEQIAALHDSQRRVTAQFLSEQAVRFADKPAEVAP